MEDNQINFNENERVVGTQYESNLIIEDTDRELSWGQFFMYFISFFILNLVVVFAIGMLIAIIEIISGVDLLPAAEEVQYMSIFQLIAFIITMIIFKPVRAFLKGQYDFSVLKEWQTYLYLVGAFAIVQFSGYIVMDVLKLEQGGSQIDLFGLDQIELNLFNIILLVIAFVVIAPITEEIMFRGVLYGFLSEKLGTNLAIAINIIIFGFLHPGHHISTGIMAIVFILLYQRTKSLIVPMLFHMIWNALATYGLLSLVAGG